MPTHEKINYAEFPSKDLSASKSFFERVFGWEFTDYGAEYTAFSDQGLDGGFFRSDSVATSAAGGALIVFYSDNLEETQTKVVASGGKIVKAIFPFPGGRRFHFVEPGGNEFAVWSKVNA
ncbi:MAG: VOC family protein [Pseudomonadota bacterium]